MADNDLAAHVLVVDDDRRLRELLRKFLSDQNFLVTTAENAADARAKLASLSVDLIVLDVMMPGENGFDLTGSLRDQSDVPILLLTARSDSSDRIQGLAKGADDYLLKPFEPQELLLRIQAILRRGHVNKPPAPAIRRESLKLGDCQFDPARFELMRGDSPVHLTSAEAGLLGILAKNPGIIHSREELMEKTGVVGIGGLRLIDVQVARLRRKIESNPRFPRYLQTVRGRGYVLRPD
ncbi:MAG: response regulator transcription factor [Alphaproteobacteria bacterium]